MLATFRSGCFQDAHKSHGTSATDAGRSLGSHTEAGSREVASSQVESTLDLQPARALQAGLPSPIPSTTPGSRALDEPTSEVANRRSSTPKPFEDDQSAGQVSSCDELNVPWYAENDDGLEDMSDDSGVLDSGTSSGMEEGSDLCLQAASDAVLEKGQVHCFEGHLLELFRVCHTCLALCRNTTVVKGSLLTVTSTCANKHTETWRSQPMLGGKGERNVATTFRVIESLNIAMITERMHYYYQSGCLLPVRALRTNTRQEPRSGRRWPLRLPGFCAKYCTCTSHEASTKKLIHIEQVQVRETAEVPSSNTTEKAVFLRGLAKLNNPSSAGHHPGVECHMRTMESGTKHYFDTWHISKGTKKLPAASRSGPCKDLEVWVQQVNNHLYYCAALGEGNGPLLVSMWMSLLNHVINKHDGYDGPYHECMHQPLSDRAWLAVGTPAYEKLRSIVASPRPLKDIQHLSPGTQTYYVEALNSLLIGFAFKSPVFSPEGMEAKTLVAALHFNENVGRYCDELLDEVMICMGKWPTLREAVAANLSDHLPPMCASYPRPPKSELIVTRRTRFASHAGSSQKLT
ncbi:hypothetical protein HPB47_026985 [Ixodes persulcatus]|uniref:Uncharacterized protein n=1 Tax=Ixodes persulcatus TaxID=34615 RepID=A0AC60PX49_IXOPE|nr:hypothetical protein HPB47_026985 [Ixodes persulcatus]